MHLTISGVPCFRVSRSFAIRTWNKAHARGFVIDGGFLRFAPSGHKDRAVWIWHEKFGKCLTISVILGNVSSSAMPLSLGVALSLRLLVFRLWPRPRSR